MTSREEIPRGEFAQKVRTGMNRSVDERGGHHPGGRYTPSAFRHYSRRIALLNQLGQLDFRTMLDVGCAEGFFMDAVRQRFGAETWGVDISDAAIRHAREDHGFNVAAADATNLPFEDDTFDLVLSTEVIEHVLDPDKMAAEMKRVARKYVVVSTPVSQTPDEHEPDFEFKHEGHVNNFDTPTMRELFGPDAKLGSFRCNSTFALVKGFGRFLPPRGRDAFYNFDYWISQRVGGPHHKFKPLRNRDWLIVAPTTATEQRDPSWRCPTCGGALSENESGFACQNGHGFGAVTAGAPDFAAEVPAA